MDYHAHKCETTGKWLVYYLNTVVTELPNWVPFSVANEFIRGLCRTDPAKVYPELFNS